MKNIATNKKAHFNYFIEETFEAGIVLVGSEVKSLRAGKVNIEESHVCQENGEIFLVNCNIPKYEQSNRFNHEERRHRKLLLHQVQVNKLLGSIKRKGATVIALSMYFNARNRVKVEIALAIGKKLFDKRATIKERDWQREKAGLLKKGNQ